MSNRIKKFGIALLAVPAMQLIAYCISAVGTILIALILKKAGIPLRVSTDEEEKGLDLSEHGEKAYI